MEISKFEGNDGRKVMVKRVYIKRPQYRYGQWQLAAFVPKENEPREDCHAVGKMTGVHVGNVGAVAFAEFSGETTMLFAHIDDLSETDKIYDSPSVNCCWVGATPGLESVMDYVRQLEQRLIAVEHTLEPRDIEVSPTRWPELGLSRKAIINALTESANA